MLEVPDLIACECCDAVHRRTELEAGQSARCRRCDAPLDRHSGWIRQRMLPLSVACLVLFAIANSFPIVEIEVRGLVAQTTLVGAVVALGAEGLPTVALLVLLTTLVFPLVYLLVLFYLSLPIRHDRLRARFGWLVRGIRSMRPWGMIEVFLLGVLIAIVKLADLAVVIPGAALFAFVGLTLLMMPLLGFDPRGFWSEAEQQEPERDR